MEVLIALVLTKMHSMLASFPDPSLCSMKKNWVGVSE